MDNNLENWHDYTVESRREIIALLRGIREKKQLVRLAIGGDSDVCVTSVLEVDPDSDSVYLDCSIDRAQNRRMVEAKRVAFESSLDKIRIMFSTETLEETTYDDRPALRMDIPESLIRLQRREFYRMETPVGNPVKVRLPADDCGAVHLLPLADISCGGIAILDNQHQLGDEIGKTFENCIIEVPEIGNVTTSLQIRNHLDIALLNGKTNRRVGCQFVNISRGNLAAVQKYITKLERERNARIAGLG
jgi:c-di-GMP-binding flagellar brake protein YcgR